MTSSIIRAVAVAVLVFAVAAAEAAESKISTVMKTVMKGDTSTYKKICLGTGSDADIQKLVNCLKGLSGTRPPKGTASSWSEKTGALIKAAEDVAAKKPGAREVLQKAGNCKACHSEHRKLL